MRRLLVFLPLLALSACMDPPPPAAAPPEVSAAAAVSLASLPAATVNGWTGMWHSGSRHLTISRSGDALFAAEAGGSAQALTLVGLGTFADASGTSYLFVPPSGGTKLQTVTSAGVTTNWAR